MNQYGILSNKKENVYNIKVNIKIHLIKDESLGLIKIYQFGSYKSDIQTNYAVSPVKSVDVLI